jgi:hypothetical protein
MVVTEQEQWPASTFFRSTSAKDKAESALDDRKSKILDDGTRRGGSNRKDINDSCPFT